MKLIVGNWKMNGLLAEAEACVCALRNTVPDTVKMVLCPPATLLTQVLTWTQDSPIAVGAQNCHWEEKGAYTGEISPQMLRDLGCDYVILGHSERRTLFQETNEMVQQKAAAAHKAGLMPIICIGETAAQRNAGQEKDIVQEQLTHALPNSTTSDNTVIAYEPIWAIGTGHSATAQDIQDMHGFMHDFLETKTLGNLPLLYGGSVKPENAGEVLHTNYVDGALIGGASLKAETFRQIAVS